MEFGVESGRTNAGIHGQPSAEQTKPDMNEWCASCIGACCSKNTVLFLTKKEHAKLSENTPLRPLAPEEMKGYGKPPFRTRYYLMQEACGNRNPETMACDIYDERPRVCREFDSGSEVCREFRTKRGVRPTPVMLGMPPLPSELA